MSNNVVREQQLQSVASAAQSFSLNTQDNTLGIVIEALATAASLPSSVIASKTTPNLSIGSWTKSNTTYTTSITYDGDGTLSTSLGTISNGTLTITDADGIFSGTITASEGTTCASSTLNFNFNTEQTPVVTKPVPTLELDEFAPYRSLYDSNGNVIATLYRATILYNGGAYNGDESGTDKLYVNVGDTSEFEGVTANVVTHSGIPGFWEVQLCVPNGRDINGYVPSGRAFCTVYATECANYAATSFYSVINYNNQAT